eukprot:3971014-Amphidinium_carterae.2
MSSLAHKSVHNMSVFPSMQSKICATDFQLGVFVWCHIVQDYDTEEVLGESCRRLSLPRRGTERLIHGSDVVAQRTRVADIPGLQPAGHVSQYQLIV